ncbi:ABC transporter ATP-binding protein [Asaccharospora irregularis]|uniref:ABC-type multidrug transport system, ATPase and permease component n=1 Tax=Asaccharospora irregularis DSM 2635 TaxID=1121321 RepID=A0A1M5SBE8_9FIRM|nr:MULTISPECIES: ABC transporter ATP-binding protein [Peptostreptococcaceae]SHH35770.1 ABC-type multidrug transport system, ATPase and permease component [Asaccharospora irregularis DSM 2635]
MDIYKNLGFIFKFIKKSKLYLIVGIVTMILSAVIITPIPYLIGYTIDNIILVNKSYNELYKVVALIILIYIIKYFLTLFYQYYLSKVQQNVVNEIRLSMINNIIESPLSFINTKEKGYILSRISESQQIGSIFNPNILNSFVGIFDLIGALIVMIYLNLKLTILCLVMIPIYYFISKKSSKKITESTIKVHETAAILNGEVYETLNGIEDIKLLNAKDIHISKVSIKLRNMMKSALKQSLNFICFIQNIILASDMVTALVLLLSGILILQNEITVGLYTSFSLYTSRILATAQTLGSLDIMVKPVCTTIVRVKEFFNLDSENNINSNPLEVNIKNISFKDVSFKYSENSEFIIKEFNEEFKEGDKILLSGINGSGKTTLIKLITALYTPTTGCILINGQDYSNLNKESIREKIGVVSQNIFLFKGTIIENILYGKKDATRQDVIDLIKEFKLDSYINRFEQGIDTEIIQNGTSISGGQAQIVAFLRAMIGEKDILILDEATSSLDIETRKMILNTLSEIEKYKILIVISHHDEKISFINKEISLMKHENKLVKFKV